MKYLILLAVSLAPMFAQANRNMSTRTLAPMPTYEAPRASTPIRVDGKLDEPAWAKAPVVELQFPWDSQTGAKQKTRVRLLWDENYLYAGYDCDDADIVAKFQQRDDPTYRDDAVELYVNPASQQRVTYFGFEMNARAVMYDYFMIFQPSHLMARFNLTGFQLATNLRGTLNQPDTDQGWSLELAIPLVNFDDFTKLPPKPGSTYLIQLVRWDGVEPNRRLSIWSDSGMERPNPHNPERFGTLKFVE